MVVMRADPMRRKSAMKKTLVPVATAVLAALTLSLAACNTTEGVGKDVKSAGKAIQDTANDARPK
jgi:predicted small secreted protein